MVFYGMLLYAMLFCREQNGRPLFSRAGMSALQAAFAGYPDQRYLDR